MTFRTFYRNTARREDGLTLIEVVVTALFVALIAIGTLTGFQDIDRVSADQRFHDEGEMLAAQAEEQLRSDPANTLDELEGSSEHKRSYTTTVDKIPYTVTQEAQYVNESKPGTECSALGASESSAKSNGDYVRVTSSVTWPQLEAAKRSAVQETSIITPPDGSTLEIDATNGASPEADLSGVSSIITYTGINAKEATTVEGRTGAGGCTVLGGIPTTSAKVEIKELPGYVTTSGSTKVPTKEVTIAPNITTHDSPIVLNEGGAITAKFTYSGGSVEGNTFVAAYEGASNSNEFTVGAPKLEYESGGEEKYKPITTEYAKSATTPMATNYIKGDLFPFPYVSTSKTLDKKWQVYAGDCTANNAKAIDSSVANGEAIVLAGKTTEVSVPMTDLAVNVYTGTSGTKLEEKELPVKITNIACSASSSPNNASSANLEHTQKTSKGHLKYVYQPFGKSKVCLAYNTTGSKAVHRTYTFEPDLTEPAAHEDTIYVEQTKEYTSSGSKDKIAVATSTSEISC